jgi:MYXO-CTERM domain-containing protein
MDVSVTLGSAEPWRDALIFHTWVNGEPWQPRSHYWLPMPTGGSWQGRGVDRLFRAAPDSFSEDPGLAATNASVLITAELPGVGAALQAAPLMVALDCTGEHVGIACDAGADGDAAVGVRDAGHTSDASVDAGISPGDAEGCGCHVIGTRATRSSSWIWSMLVVALLAARRVRDQRIRKGGAHG